MELKSHYFAGKTMAARFTYVAIILVLLGCLLMNNTLEIKRQASAQVEKSERSIAALNVHLLSQQLLEATTSYDPTAVDHDDQAKKIRNAAEQLSRSLKKTSHGETEHETSRWSAAKEQVDRLLGTATRQQAQTELAPLTVTLREMREASAIEGTESNTVIKTSEWQENAQLVLVVAIMLCAVWMLGMGRYLTGRSRVLTDTVQKIAGGDFELRAEIKGEDELSYVAHAFNEMTDQVLAMLDKEGRFFTLSSHLLCVVGFDGRFKRMSSAWAAVLQQQEEALLEAPLLSFVHADDRERTSAAMQQVIGLGVEIERLDNRVVSPDGSVRWLSWNLKPVPADEQIYCIAMEITKRRQAEADREKLIESIQEGTVRLSGATAGVVTSTSQHFKGAQEQAAAISETVAAVEEVEQTTRQSAARAAAVAESSQLALETGRAGRKAVEETIAAMERVRKEVESIAQNILTLAEQAQNIGEIVSSVDHIADQTNLLALNAAIEAARAGEQGKGFTVVANEIRLLADQSKRATVQVRQMLSGIQKLTQRSVLSMEEGTRSVGAASTVVMRADDTIRELVETVTLAATNASQILTSANQQSVGMKQIHQAMKNIQEIMSETLSATENARAAVHELNDLAETMQSMLATNGHAVVLR